MLYDGQEDIAKIEFEYYKEDINISLRDEPKMAQKSFDSDSSHDENRKMDHLHFRNGHF